MNGRTFWPDRPARLLSALLQLQRPHRRPCRPPSPVEKRQGRPAAGRRGRPAWTGRERSHTHAVAHCFSRTHRLTVSHDLAPVLSFCKRAFSSVYLSCYPLSASTGGTVAVASAAVVTSKTAGLCASWGELATPAPGGGGVSRSSTPASPSGAWRKQSPYYGQR